MLNKNYAITLLFSTTFLCYILTYLLYIDERFGCAIVASVLSAISTGSLLIYLFANRTFMTRYEFDLKKKIKSYSSCLVETSDLPVIENKNVIVISNFEGMMDAQATIKKSVFYKKEVESCVFMLVDDSEVCIYIDKLNDKSISPYEVRMNSLLRKKLLDVDHSILDDLDKTTIIKFDEFKKYKVSPIKKKDGE